MTQPSHDDVTRARLIPPVPVAVAPMAGGPSTPELVAAVVGAGGGGFLAGGMRTAAQMRAQVDALRALLGAEGPDRWGVNLFVPDAVNTAIPDAARTEAARSARTAAVAAYRADLTADGAADLPTAADVVPDPDAERADFDALLTAAEEQAWPLVSFTFGLPAADVFARLAAAGIPAGATVTDATEARAALEHGAAFLVVQGHRAGGHRGTSDPAAEPTRAELPTVLAAVRDVVGTGAASAAPVVAAGGVGTAEEILYLLGILLHPSNQDIPFPLVFTGPASSAEYFEKIDEFLVYTLGEEIRRFYTIITGDPTAVARTMRDGIQQISEFRRQHQDAFYYNWRLTIAREFQAPFEPTHEAMRSLALHRQQPTHELAANLRRAFSGIVAGNVKEPGIRAIEAHGPFELTAEPELMQRLDALLSSFVAQGRMKLDGQPYTPCYVLK